MTDPTLLTTQQLLRELQNLKENFSVRLDAIDKATKLFEENLTRVPTEVDKAVGHLRELHDERFEGINILLKERDHTREESARNNRAAIEAALRAAKEAAEKTEHATTKQLDSIMRHMDDMQSTFNDKIEDGKQRLMVSEGQIATILGRSSGAGSLWGIIVGAVGVISGMLGWVAFILTRP